MYNAIILADSLSPQGDRLTTLKITYPRIIHAEMCRHRTHSRNTASSRAIPFKKMLKDVQNNPFIPIAWQKPHTGMQGTEYLTNQSEIEFARSVWLNARDSAVKNAQELANSSEKFSGVTKQLCNRLLEPFTWTTEIISATEWKNFFDLRCPQYKYQNKIFYSKKQCLQFFKESKNHYEYLNNLSFLDWLKINQSQADIHIQAIAELIWDSMNESNPTPLKPGEWHIPNLGHQWDQDKLLELANGDLNEKVTIMLKISTAHNARISYTALGTNPEINYQKDIQLHDKLAKEKHLSPFEHCARAMSNLEYFTYHTGLINGKITAEHEFTSYFTVQNQVKMLHDKQNGWCRNFKGFISYRSLIEN